MRTPDRADLVPSNWVKNTLPNQPLYTQLLRLAYDAPQRVIICDVNRGEEKSRIQLLTDVIELRETLRLSLSESARRDLERGETVFIAVLAPGGYEYVVALLGALALGASAVPISIQAPVEEAWYVIEKSRCAAVLTAMVADELGTSLEHYVRTKKQLQDFRKIAITPCLKSWCYQPQDILVSPRYLDENAPGVTLFTSGTTGPPKGAVFRRGYIHEGARQVADHYSVTTDDRVLHLLPVHHGSGANLSILPFLIRGACIEFRSGSFSAEWTWNRWKRGGITFFSGVPTMYVRMMRYFEQHISHSDIARRDYATAAKNIRCMLCGTSTLPRPVQHFWEELRGGDRILLRYGTTEAGAIFKMTLDPGNTPDGSVGVLQPGVDIKLAGGGEEGELLTKSPTMFMGYLFDEKATKDAHDPDGYFKTGDIVRREGDYYFILGRASVDVLKSGGYKISALDIERECLGLPYVNEVMVVGVDDTEWGQRVGAVLSLRTNQKVYSYRGINGGKPLTLAQLRSDLSNKLARYKLPTLLRVIPGELPKTPTGKVNKKLLGPHFFPSNYTNISDVQVFSPSPKKQMEVSARL